VHNDLRSTSHYLLQVGFPYFKGVTYTKIEEDDVMQQDLQEPRQLAERIDALIQKVATFTDPRAREITEELIQSLLDMYGEGLSRILEITAETNASGLALIEVLSKDELVSSLFLLHGLHPIDVETRITQALVEVRPYLKSHGGNVELIKVEDGVAYLRLEGSCHGCPSSTITLKLAIEEAIFKAAPDIERLEVEGVTEPPKRAGIPVAFIPPKRSKDKNGNRLTEPESEWSVVSGLASLSDGAIRVIAVQNASLLFCLIAGTYYAYHNRCGGCNESLEKASLEGTSLVCSSCGRHFDVCRAGRCLDAHDLYLQPVPLLVEGGKVKVAMSIEASDDQSRFALSAL
jgi:Fe-S cluster biogenesis protein NfuA/nitrite reductase/ring-hydroxylating ferredoxin subunit